MKKHLFLALAAIVSLVFASCSEDLTSFGQREGDIDVTYTVGTQSVPTTRAEHDGDGKAANVNRYICEVWHETSEGLTLHKRIENVVAPGQKTTTFTLRLVSKQNYKVLFWADHAEVVGTGEVDGNSTTAADIYYDTKTDKGLQEVTLKKDESNNYVGNNDELDAFYAFKEIGTLNETIEQDVTLTRPFAQLNVITTDVDDIRKNAVSSTLNPNKIKMTVNAPTKFDVLTGKASAEEDIEYTAAVYYNISKVNKTDIPDYTNSYAYCTLAMNYYFAPENEKAVETVKLVALNGDKELVSPVYANIPLQRNYRTNIIGDLLTDAVNYNVTIDPIWTLPANDVQWTKVATVTDIPAAFAAGKTNVEVLTAPTTTTTIAIPKTFSAGNEESVGIKLPATSAQITFNYGSETQAAPANINIVVENSSDNVTINCPNSHVTLNGQYLNVDASTSSTTLVIEKDVTIAKLTITEGGVEIHGTVNELIVSPASGKKVVFRDCENLNDEVYNVAIQYLDENYIGKKINGNNCIVPSGFYCDNSGVYHVTSLDGLKTFRSKASTLTHKTVVLEANINLNNEEWEPIKGSYITFDGNGKTISNVKVTGTAKNVGLFGQFSISTIKNLTVDGADVTGINHVAALCGDGLCAKIENCVVKNAKVTTVVYNNDDGDKAGAICGYLSGESDAWVKNCIAENCTITGYRDIGGLVGYANGSAEVIGNTINNAKVICDKKVNANYKNYTNDSEFDVHEVVGEAVSTATISNNKTENVTVSFVNE